MMLMCVHGTVPVFCLTFDVLDGGKEDVADDEEGKGSHDCRAGNGKDPGRNHLARYVPVNGFDTLGGADTHDGARYDVGRRYGQVQQCGRKDDDCRVEVGSKSVNGMHLEYLAADGTDDFPSAYAGTQGHSSSAEQFDDSRDFQCVDESAGKQGQCNDPHGFLGIIGTVRKGHESGRQDLQPVGRQIDDRRTVAMTDGKDEIHDNIPDDDSGNRGQNQGEENLQYAPAVEGPEADRNGYGANHTADERMGGTGGHADVPGQEVPDDGPCQAGDDDQLVDHIGRNDDIAADCFGNACRNHGTDKVQDGRTDDSQARADSPRRYAGGDGVGRIVEPVDKIENQGQDDDEDNHVRIKHTS